MTLIVTFLWSGGWQAAGTFEPVHVLGLKNQVAKHVTRPHRFVCIASPEYITPLNGMGIETFPIWDFPQVQHPTRMHWDCFVRLGLLGEHGTRLAVETGIERFLMLDVDTVIRSNIDDIVDDVQRADIKWLWFLAGRDEPMFDLWRLRRGYSGALWGGKLGSQPHVWAACFDKALTDRAMLTYIGSDQALATLMLPGIPTWTDPDGICLRACQLEGYPPWRITFATGASDRKPWNNPKLRDFYYAESGLPNPHAVSKRLHRHPITRREFKH